MVIEKEWQAQFSEVFPELDAGESMPLAEPGTAPLRKFIMWDNKDYLPQRDTIKIWAAWDLASTRPVQIELEFWFAYEQGIIIKRYNKTPDIRFRLLMIYGKGDTPNPEQITPLTGMDHTPSVLEHHFRLVLRHSIREAILTKLGAEPHEVMGLDKVITRHTTVTSELDRGE